MKKHILFLPFTFLLFTCLSFAQTLAPGSPGKDAQWASAGKQGVGTSATLESKVWFTLQGGALTEVYYPNVAVGNVHLLQFVVVNPKTKKVETERVDAIHKMISEDDYYGNPKYLSQGDIIRLRSSGINLPLSKKVNEEDKLVAENSLHFIQENVSKSGKWKIKKRYITDVENNTVLIRVFFEAKDKNLQLYLMYDPSLANSGMGDTSWNDGKILYSEDNNVASALLVGDGRNSEHIGEINNGFYKNSDGIEQLRQSGGLVETYLKAENGNVVQLAKIISKEKNSAIFTVSLGFGSTPASALDSASKSLKKGFDESYKQYVQGWNSYVKTLRKVDPKYQGQFNMAAMILKAHEDKIHRGANIASMSVPWGGGDNANEDNVGGYHLVWSRDLYQVFTAYMALGDTAAAERALDFLLKVQQKLDGSFPQNSWLDGKPFWGSLQMDEVAYPLIMAYQLKRFDKETYTKHLKPAADFIVKNGPATPQERWEEEAGFSPSTIAAEIAGLVCVAEIAKKNGDLDSAIKYLKTADEWEANIEKWTATTTGKYGDGNYYLRITNNGKPDAGEKIELNNGAGFFDEREIVDAGFLELVRLGIKSPDDPLIAKSVKVIDEVIKVNTPNGEAFYRYNHDGYGEMDDGRRWNWDGKYTGKGRLWVLLSGERGQYELALANIGKNIVLEGNYVKDLFSAKSRLNAMQKFANNGLMIPEQVWDKKEVPEADSQFSPNLQFGEGTGSATPLAWSMAQFIRLAVNLQAGKNLDTPDIVYERYVLRKKDKLSIENDTDNSSKDKSVNSKLISKLVSASNSSPVITKNTATFIYKGNGKKIEIAGDFTEWKPKHLFTEIRAEGIPSISKRGFTFKFPANARIEYKLVVDGEWITDPLNLNKVDNGVGGENSVLEMPDYEPSKWAFPVNDKTYDLDEIQINSKIYGMRNVLVYVPEGFKDKELPVMYLQDGTDYIKRAEACTVQRNLVKAGKIKPFIMVFVDYKDRMKEYWASDDYAKYLATEIVPVIDGNYKTLQTRKGRAILGASLGGITSIWTAVKYPQVFANVGGQSSSFWVDDERVVKELVKLKGDEKFNFYIDDGTFEGVEDSLKVTKMLREKGFKVAYVQAETGHNWTSWRDRLADAFVAIWK